MNKHLKHLLYVSIWTFVVVVCWIVFLLLIERSSPVVSEETIKLARELEPQFDEEALSQLRKRKTIPANLSDSLILNVSEAGTAAAQINESN